ncbi:hypothetical protein OWR29_28700 [Actinoplanes sp. Pm04-4]|uniref:Uncharacterized protein n=1 Tax=Paractinoplanes pyxinae TaxID=2997416 RepID=A0ABT4B666_9ACTN|nr:hypothetical protein [Actinoplanes pyxinae]MCY1141992.1 hypothetical protein [Actinoplanes pyxinae]
MTGPSYSRVVGQAALQAVVNSAWIAAGGLPPAKRRLARFGTVAAGIAAYSNLPDVRRSIREARADIAALRARAENTSPPEQTITASPRDQANIASPRDPAEANSSSRRTAPPDAEAPQNQTATPDDAAPDDQTAPPDVAPSRDDGSAPSDVAAAARNQTAPPDAAAAPDDRTATPTDAATSPSRRAGTPADRPLALSQADKRRLAAVGAMLAFTMAVNFGRRRLQKRWLAHLIQDGHAHPHRALAVRIAPVAFAVELAVQMAGMYAAPRKPD